MDRHTGIVGLLLVLLGFLLGAGPAVADCPEARVTPLAELRAGRVAEDRRVTIEGIVTGTFTGGDRLGGFFLQDEDTPPVGLFVYAPALDNREPNPGDRVQVAGRFTRFHERPQVGRITDLNVCAHEGLPHPVVLRLPRDAARLAKLQDVKVRLDQALTVTGNAQLGRYGSLRLAAGGRLFRPGQGAAVHARDSDSARQIVLDDGSYRANPEPIPYLDAEGTRRVGDQIEGLTGILTHAFGAHRIHPTRVPVFHAGNPRPAPPAAPDANLRVATLNVENYFLTLGSRGASTRAELRRQRQKLTAALRSLDADVISLSEVENRGGVLDDLVATINRGAPNRQRYRAVAQEGAGTDAIRNAVLYRPARVTLFGSDADPDPVHNRSPLLAWFRPAGHGEPFGVVAVHFKAKVGCPTHGDVDRGQGCWNELRTAQAKRLLDWLNEVRRDDTPILIAGDLNAYAAEDPVATLLASGKGDLTTPHLPPPHQYTYVFRGEAGQLDYLLAGPTLAGKVANAGIWHINADEPPFLGFTGRQPAIGPWRSSDHDPVWVDITN